MKILVENSVFDLWENNYNFEYQTYKYLCNECILSTYYYIDAENMKQNVGYIDRFDCVW